ncbi:MAG TPA: C69 family dipeptidase [Chloroflexota bacterium]|nr:C69 family dipeptidase [Chloroflexota bacterium]
MCDTSVVTGSATADGSVIFAKNSDRKANECQPLCYYLRRDYPANSRLRCTHREIPQARETFALIGSQPYWMWGFEIGVNEHGVAIGNEAVYGREGYEETGLLGMDYLRLGLERGRTAHDALHVMVELLERFGQGGNADILQPRSYHNSFIIADPTEAWVFETAGRYWAAERVEGRRAISNCYTIGADWDEASAGLIDHAVAQGWWSGSQDFNFAQAYGDPGRDVRSGQCRFQRATRVLGGQPRLTVADMLAVLRDHDGVLIDASGQSAPAPICMHETPPRVGATAASIVAHLRPHQPAPLTAVAWHSFGSPCLSGVHPIYVAADAPDSALATGGGRFDPASPFWLNERIQRRVDAYPTLKPLVQARWRETDRDAFAAADRAEECARLLPMPQASADLRALSAGLTRELLATLRDLDELTAQQAAELPPPPPEGQRHWAALNDAVGFDLVPHLVAGMVEGV